MFLNTVVNVSLVHYVMLRNVFCAREFILVNISTMQEKYIRSSSCRFRDAQNRDSIFYACLLAGTVFTFYVFVS